MRRFTSASFSLTRSFRVAWWASSSSVGECASAPCARARPRGSQLPHAALGGVDLAFVDEMLPTPLRKIMPLKGGWAARQSSSSILVRKLRKHGGNARIDFLWRRIPTALSTGTRAGSVCESRQTRWGGLSEPEPRAHNVTPHSTTSLP